MSSAALLLAGLQLAGLADDLGGCRRIEEQGARLACYDALASGAPAPAENSGAGSLPKPGNAEEPSRIEAHLFGKHDGWHKETRFVLDNGQVWVCIDDQEGFETLDGNAITIERDRSGGYRMRVARVAGDIRVRREQ